MRKQSNNLIKELVTITGWSPHRVVTSLSELRRYGLIEMKNGQLILKEVG